MARRFPMKLIASFALAIGLATAARAGPALTVEPAPGARMETVFDWSTDRCEESHVPDAPARAFRTATGEVRLFATHHSNRSMVGPDLGSVAVDCAAAMVSDRRDDPAAYDDLTWLTSFYTFDGETVFALGHNEFLGHRRPELCPAGTYAACWSNAITFARSGDGGRSFAQPPAPEHLVAALPYRYRGDRGRRVGLFNPSNIVAHDGYYYVMAFAERLGAQKRGTCLLRTDDLSDPDAWRAWDGDGFTVRFADPYRTRMARPARHVCAPVSPRHLNSQVTGITRHDPSGLFVALMASHRAPEPGAAKVSGIFATTSPDLIHWSRPVMVWKAPVLWRRGCGEPAFAYPALLDPDSPGRNFEATDDTAYLYMTRFNLSDCQVTWDRDLVRLPVAIRPAWG